MSGNTFTLYNNVAIPPIAYGTDRTFTFIRKNVVAGVAELFKDLIIGKRRKISKDLSIYKLLQQAPENGCTLFDTSSAYGQSERILKYALKKYKREDLFIITKVSNQEQRSGNIRKALKRSLNHLGVDYVDLYLMHWPQTGTFLKCWKEMEMLYEEGLAKSIGVCNFKEHHFDELMEVARIRPMACQIESHPLFSQNDMLNYCKNNQIQMMAYTATGRMDKRLRENQLLNDIAEKYHKNVAQVILRWHHQRGVIPVVNTTSLEHLRENMNIFDFELTAQEMDDINGINIDCRLRYDPDTVDFNKC